MPRLENRRLDVAEAMRTSEFFNGKKDIAKIGSGDSYYIADFLKKERNELFEKIIEEGKFTQMFNISKDSAEAIPRLVTAQSERKEDGASAIYRMPGCNEKNIETTELTPIVKYICDKASEEIGQSLNHVVLSLFMNENDSLGFHYDKLVDLMDNSYILSISFGDTRPILFYSLDGKHRQTIMLRPGSLLAIGPKTNKQYMHAIPKLTEQVGPRVSLSCRTVQSYIKYDKTETENSDEQADKKFEIIGKGAEWQCANYPFSVSHDDPSAYSDGTKKVIGKFAK
jgi:hypothetical protein